jgi:hypothetical protein
MTSEWVTQGLAISAPEIVTAVGTVALAITGLLAYKSNSKLVDATKDQAGEIARQARSIEAQTEAISDQAQVARDALARQIEPRLASGSPEDFRIENAVASLNLQERRFHRILVPLVNHGFGPAFIRSATAESSAHGSLMAVPPPVLGAGQTGHLQLTSSLGGPDELPIGTSFQLAVEYSGQDGESRILRLAITYYGETWEIREPPVGLG